MYCILLKETMHHLTTKEIFIQCSPKFIFSSDQPSRIICILEDIIFLKGLCFQITGNHNCFFSLQIHSTDSGIFGPNNVKLGKKTTMMNAYQTMSKGLLSRLGNLGKIAVHACYNEVQRTYYHTKYKFVTHTKYKFVTQKHF